MLNRARDEAGGITTLKLARGSITNSPPRSTSTPGSWTSLDGGSVPRSPDTRGKPSGLQILGNVGIIELLEQDDRPTFIVDVANPANLLPGGPLQVVFANASLRACEVCISIVVILRKFFVPNVMLCPPICLCITEFEAQRLLCYGCELY